MTPVTIVLVGVPEAPDAASNKRVKGRPPEPASPPPQRQGQWPVNQPIPDPRRHLDAARREVANSRGEIERLLRSPGL
jgi:hypothetical protein